jgi:tRNA threonylcarbamoyladenosine biosynthesis protein TsaB
VVEDGVTLNPNGWVLGIDTSSDVASLALVPLADNEVFGAEIAWEAARNQTATLLAEIDHLCRLTGIESDDFAAVVIATGPGGFNALRVGMSVAKGFAFAGDIPIVGVATLDIAAHSVANWSLPVRAFIPAGRRRVVYRLRRLPPQQRRIDPARRDRQPGVRRPGGRSAGPDCAYR